VTVEIFEILRQKLGAERVLCDEPMRYHTTFKVGGPADVFVKPRGVDELIFVLRACRDGSLSYFVMGNGSNLLVKDDGIRGVVISMAELSEIKLLDSGKVYAQAGAKMPDVSKFALEHGLAGLEFAEGIPGSVGGGVVMNAGAYGGEIKDVFHIAQAIDKNCQLVDIDLQAMDFSYRKSATQEQGCIICSVTMELAHGNKPDIAAKMADYRTRRQEKQPLAVPSAGSTFKRPPGHFAGKLIMDAGLRGFTIGGAQVSEKHCGFVVNIGKATAADILELIEHVQSTVMEKFGVRLETEVKIVGE
jgi:UDP-N-acetylmuramate dehydrogenase